MTNLHLLHDSRFCMSQESFLHVYIYIYLYIYIYVSGIHVSFSVFVCGFLLIRNWRDMSQYVN